MGDFSSVAFDGVFPSKAGSIDASPDKYENWPTYEYAHVVTVTQKSSSPICSTQGLFGMCVRNADNDTDIIEYLGAV